MKLIKGSLKRLIGEGYDDWKLATPPEHEFMDVEDCDNEEPRESEEDDYEQCGDCGYDHEYEPSEAQGWHKMHGAPGIGIHPGDDEMTRERKLTGLDEGTGAVAAHIWDEVEMCMTTLSKIRHDAAKENMKEVQKHMAMLKYYVGGLERTVEETMEINEVEEVVTIEPLAGDDEIGP